MGSTPRGISASRGAAVLGLSEYQSPFEVWQRICEERRPGFNAERGYTPPDEPDNAAIRWGTAFEDAIVELASAKQGWPIHSREKFYEMADGMITCHVDGIYDELTLPAALRLHEGKTTSIMNFWDSWGTPGTDRVPPHYQVQVQQQMLCTGASEAIVSVLVFPRRVDEWEKEGLHFGTLVKGDGTSEPLIIGPDESFLAPCREWARVFAQAGLFHQYPVAASPTLQRTLVDAYRDFWHTYVLPEREPDITKYDDYRRAFPAPKGTVVATERVERWAAEFHAIGDEIGDSGRLKKRREELKLLMLAYMRAADRAMDDESREATVLRDQTGRKLASFNGKTFR